jgi:hypothetical protein
MRSVLVRTGYFTLPLLVHAKAKHLHACELNPDSVEALRRGLAANGVADRCTVYPGDNQLNAPQLKGQCDRVHLGLIPSSELAWPLACAALRRDKPGMLHVHANVNKAQIDEWAERLQKELCRLLSGRAAAGADDAAAAAGEDDAADDDAAAAASSASLEAMHPAQRAIWAAAAATRARAQEGEGEGEGEGEPWTVEVLHIELVKWYAPKIRHVVADVRCTPPGVDAQTQPAPKTQPQQAPSSTDSQPPPPPPAAAAQEGEFVCAPSSTPTTDAAAPAKPPVSGVLHAWTAGCPCCTPGGSDGRGKMGPMF